MSDSSHLNIIVISSSPNTDGLTAACAAAAVEGAGQENAQVEEVRLNDLNVGMCHACGNGWGTCIKDHTCQVKDDFQALQKRMVKADAIVLVTPVYWCDMSESLKALIDRMRRCETPHQDGKMGLLDTPVIVVAAAGGSGHGMITCLEIIERWIDHVRAKKFDFVPVNRWNRIYKIETIREGARAIVKYCTERVSS